MGVKVELRPLSRGASKADEDKAFKGMYAAFKRLVNETGILTEFNRKQYFETKSQKIRRKRKEAELARRREESNSDTKSMEEVQTNWREHFGR